MSVLRSGLSRSRREAASCNGTGDAQAEALHFSILEVGIGRSLRGIAVDVGGTSTEAVGKEKGGIFHVLCRQGGTGLRQHDDGQCVCLRDHLLWRYGLGVWR